MNNNNKGLNEVVFNIEEFLVNTKMNSENDISAKTSSDIRIIPEEIKNNKERRDINETERMIDILLNQIYTYEYKRVDNLGRQAINDWIFENIIFQDLNNQIVIDYFNFKKYLDPCVFLLVVETIKEYVRMVAHYFKCMKIEELTIAELNNIDIYNNLLNKLDNQVKKIYLVSFINFLNPDNKIKIQFEKNDKVQFYHPLVQFCEVELRKQGVKETSINSNLTEHIKKHFQWLCRNLKEFENYNINSIVVNQIKKEHLMNYKSYLIREVKGGVLSELTAKRHLQYIKRFYTMLYSKNKITKNIGVNISNLTADDYIYRELPSNDEMQNFFDIVQTYSDVPIVERLVFLLMTHLGLRSCEVSKLKWQEINMDNKTISFTGKGDYRSILPIPKVVLENLVELGVKETGYIFSDNTEYFKNQIYQNYKLYTMIGKWKFRGGPHLLRHLYISNLTKHCSPRVLKVLSRHETSCALSKYIHVDNNRLTKAIDMIII